MNLGGAIFFLRKRLETTLHSLFFHTPFFLK
nr:MAG TPA: hypothetical protein [Caudoviricetes sp.]